MNYDRFLSNCHPGAQDAFRFDDFALYSLLPMTFLLQVPPRQLLAKVVGWAVLVFGLVLGLAAAPDADALQSAFERRWPNGDMARFQAWRALIVASAAATDNDKLKRANDFFNRNIQFGEDRNIWGQSDYWATPIESLGRGAGDCEDFVIAKLYTLMLMGIPADKLRLIYVQARTGSSAGVSAQAHMVLAYYVTPDAEPLVLDNLVGDVRPASRRPDLLPVFSFNLRGIFSGASGALIAPSVGAGRLSRWEDLLRRARAEGFE